MFETLLFILQMTAKNYIMLEESWRTGEERFMLKYLIILGIICILIVAEWMREIYTFKTTHYHIQSSKLKKLKRERKVILLSDLHNCSYGKENERLLQAIRDENPDLILVAGDMLVGKSGVSTEVAENFMVQLPKICETYYGNGNHEQRMKEYPEVYGDVYAKYKEVLEKAGVRFLENETNSIDWDGAEVRIYGLEISCQTYERFKKVSLSPEEVETAIGKAKETAYNILIAHNPAFADTHLKWGADLIVSGHIHGGIARIPGIGGVISPQGTLFPKYSGEMTKRGDAAIVVSKGIGLHTIKVRLFNPAEIVVMHIRGSEE